MVNAYDDIYVEKAGRLVSSEVSFTSDDAVMATIERIISPLGRRIDESSPMVDARLRDGSRVNAIIPPLALRGPCITIRKFPDRKLTDRDLISYGSINEQMVTFLRSCVEQRRNIIVSGGTGSGKTTLLNILSNYIPEEERVVTIEDAAELRLGQPHVVSLEARPANMEGRGQVTIRDLVKNSLRMRPDRIVVGECRGGEALDMLQAMNTGHDGSLTTAHANSPRDMLRRMEVMVLMAGMDLPVSAIREQIASAVDIVIQQTRFADGTRKISHISEITGMESGTIQLNDIYLYKQSGFDDQGRVKGTYQATGMVPLFYEDLRERGLQVDMSLFRND
jgi:pilus assembly protein CpaF